MYHRILVPTDGSEITAKAVQAAVALAKQAGGSLVTVSALIASGQSAQIGYHLNRAMDNGLTAEEAGEIVSHSAFYAGWPNAFSAAPVVGEVLRARAPK